MRGAYTRYPSVLALLLVLLSPQHASSQVEVVDLARFRLRLTSGERVEGQGGVLTDSTLVGRSAAGAPLRIRSSDIRLLEVRAGSQARRGAVIGAGMGLATALLAIAQASTGPTGVDRGRARTATIGLTVGGGIVGALVGLKGSRWRRVPVDVSVGGGSGRVSMTYSVICHF